MPTLLLELFSEEIPARMQRAASEAMQAELQKALAEIRLTHGTIKPYFSPRRIAFIIPDLPAAQPDLEVERKGPATNAPEAAIEGFLRSTGLTKEQCEIRLVGKQECYFAVIKEQGKPTAEALVPLINKVIAGYTWPKSMRWGAYECSYVRPLQNICCLLDSDIIPVSFAHITANNKTFGHRFMAPAEIALKSPAEYEAALEKAFVIADADKRKKLIADTMASTAAKLGLEVVEDAALLEEVTGLVEWPVILQGRIGDEFMDLPPEVLRSEMRNHQKYFNLRKKGTEGIAPQFIITSNLVASDGGKAIIAGNERVLRARLADGRFYWDQDRKKALSDWAKGLENMVFHAKIGHMAYRVERIAILAKEIAKLVPNADAAKVHRAALLAKADLTSGMVGEFPELQGIMGRYYALGQKEAPEVADAIRDHYLPLGPGSSCPTEPTAVVVSLADKIDSLAGLFAIGDKPTGSKDPYALRRAALGVIRIILENKLRLPLSALFGHALSNYINLEHKTQDNETTRKELLAFFADRLKVMLKDQGLRHDVIDAVLSHKEDDDFMRVKMRIEAIDHFMKSEDAQNLFAAYKRCRNIISKSLKGEWYDTLVEPNPALFKEPQEHDLYSALTSDSLLAASEHLDNERYAEALVIFSSLRKPTDAFFESVMVNDADDAIRTNRILLLQKFTFKLDHIAAFSKIEG